MSTSKTTKFLEPWMDPAKWVDEFNPTPLHYGPHPDFELHINDCRATDADVKVFQEKGYWVGPKILADDTIKLLRDEFKRVYEGEVDYPCHPYEYYYWLRSVRKHYENDPAVRKINNTWYINAVFRKLVTNNVIGGMAAKLLGTDEIRLWHDQAIWKPAEGKDAKGAGNIGWHQDYGYWQCSNNTSMCTAWIPLQDVNLENGAMRTITGSHKWGLIKDSATFFEKDMDGLKEKFAAVATGPWQDEPCVMKAGQIVFHHSLTFHGSGANFSNEPRLAVALRIALLFSFLMFI
eukprot:Phypoly_transcript_10892.p1 GENE.Phypoly_transcript_10892~~Phypoly_transcript_10892.p1  ORF type:complete len:291 (+),score=32.65 Phypoly_transcript_10892:105-977(+)